MDTSITIQRATADDAQEMVAQTKAFGATRGWTPLEVTTPPLPELARTLAFYEREGFAISGGRKLKVVL